MTALEEVIATAKMLEKEGIQCIVNLMEKEDDKCSFECGPADNRHKIYYNWEEGEEKFNEKIQRLSRQMNLSESLGLSKPRSK